VVYVVSVRTILLIGVLFCSISFGISGIRFSHSESEVVQGDLILCELPEMARFQIDENSDFTSLGFPGSGTAGDPYRIEGIHFTDESFDMEFIVISGTTAHFVIQNCVFDGTCEWGLNVENIEADTCTIQHNVFTSEIYYRSIEVEMADGSIIKNNTCQTGVEYGIQVVDSSNCVIEDNDCRDMQYDGIRLLDGSNNCEISNNLVSGCTNAIDCQDSDYVTIQGHDVDGCDWGIVINNCQHCVITDNEIHDSLTDGIRIIATEGGTNDISVDNNEIYQNGWCGVIVTNSDNVQITNNMIHSNDEFGIDINYDSIFLITDNLIQSNANYGVVVNGSSSTGVIYHNQFKFNTDGSKPQGNDVYNSGTWYNPTVNRGNYWSDWDGTGEYELAGHPSASDPYPLSGFTTTPSTESTSAPTSAPTETTTSEMSSETQTEPTAPGLMDFLTDNILIIGGGIGIIIVIIIVVRLKR